MTTPNNYAPVTATGSGATVTVPVEWPFSLTTSDLSIQQQNTSTGEIKTDGFLSVVRVVGEAVSVEVTNFYGSGTEIEVTIARATLATQEFGQADGEALAQNDLESQLDKIVRAIQEKLSTEDAFLGLDPNTPDRLLTVDVDGNIIISNLDFEAATGILQVIDDDKLTLKGGPGFEGFDLTIDGNTQAATLTLSGQAAEQVVTAQTSAVNEEVNVEYDINTTLMNFFKAATGLTRALRIWGGATTSDDYMEITVNETVEGRANYQGTVGEHNFIGDILLNGTPLTEILNGGQYIEATFDNADLATDADGSYYLFGHNFDTDSPINVAVFDSNGQQVQTVNVKDPTSASTLKNNIKVYVNGYTPLVGDFSISAFTGTPATSTPGQLTADEVAGIKNAATPVTAANPVITLADQAAAQLTPDQVDAINGATTPSAGNVFLTAADQQLTTDELAAVQNAATAPTALNPFLTDADAPVQLTSDELAGIQNSPTPLTAANPVASQADIAEVSTAFSELLIVDYSLSAGATPVSYSAGVWTKIPLSTIVENFTSDVATLTSGVVALPAGTYRVVQARSSISAFFQAQGYWGLRVYNTDDSQEVVYGDLRPGNAFTEDAEDYMLEIGAGAKFTIIDTTNFEFQGWYNATRAMGLSRIVDTNHTTVHARLVIQRIS